MIQKNDALKLGAAIVQDRSHYFWFLGKQLFLFCISIYLLGVIQIATVQSTMTVLLTKSRYVFVSLNSRALLAIFFIEMDL